MPNFQKITEHETVKIINSVSNATCAADPIPTKLLKSVQDVLKGPVTQIMNMSLETDRLKDAILKSLLKKPGHLLKPQTSQ